MVSEIFEYLKIIAISIICVIAYGIANDQITARILLDFYALFGLSIKGMSPTEVAFLFGVIATWWVGLILGVPLSFAARFGSRPKSTASDIFPTIFKVLVVVSLLAAFGGIVVWLLQIKPILPPQITQFIPQEKANQFVVVNTVHLIGYVGGFVGGLVLIVATYISREPGQVSRVRPHQTNSMPDTRWFKEGLPRWLQAIIFSIVCVIVFFLYYYIPPGIITIALTIGIAGFVIWILLDPVRRYTRLLSMIVGIWGSSTAIPFAKGYVQAAGIDVTWDVGNGPDGAFHVAFAVVAIALLAADFFQRNITLFQKQ